MKKTTKQGICAVLVLFSLLSLAGCGAQPLKYKILEPYGYYPNTKDFPDTKWVCKEVDMWFYMFADGEQWMTGAYTAEDGEVHPFRAKFAYNYVQTDLAFYFETFEADTILFRSPEDDPPFIAGDYIYKDDSIIFWIFESDAPFWEYEGKKLTFEMVETIAQKPEARWRCQELDLYIDSFSDAEGYYKGEMLLNVLDKGQITAKCQTYPIRVIAVPNNPYHCFRAYGNYDLILMCFEVQEDRMIATIPEYEKDGIFDRYEYWTYEGTTLTFVREALPEG